jgi:transposase
MLTFSPQTRIFVAIEPIDFRSGIDRIAQICRTVIGENPMSGAVFVFCNRRRTAIRLLMYDGQGFWLCHKRLSSGRLTWWPSSSQPHQLLAARELQVLLWSGNPPQAAMPSDWRAIATDSAAS